MEWFLLIFLSTTPLFVSSSLECYECLSRKSLEDCESKQKKTPGCEGNNRTSSCYIFESRDLNGTVSVGKHCIATEKCTKDIACPKDNDKCEIHCCPTPLCNEGNDAVTVKPNTLFPILILVVTIFYTLQLGLS